MSDAMLRIKAREAVLAGRLPSARPERIWGGPGMGERCAVCQEPIEPQESELELQFAGQASYHVHVRCFAAWESEQQSRHALRPSTSRASLTVMGAIRRTGHVADDRPERTLGGLLYSGGTNDLPLEKDWVALVRGMAAGNQLALRELYGRSYRLVFTLTMRITSDAVTAEELTVDVFHEAWRRAGSYDPANGTVIGWLMNLARSRAIDRLRLEQRKRRIDPRADEEPVAATDNCGAEEPLVTAERGLQLRNALTALTAGERQAIETAYFLGLTHEETAVRLGEPLGTVKTRIRSGLAKLREALAQEYASP
jgi:RNA polymerase sigma-70 factor, ECF subfamily